MACVRLDLFAKLAAGPRTTAELSRELGLSVAVTERLLLAAVSLRLVAQRGPQRFGLGMLGAAMNGNPGIAEMVMHHAMLYRDLEDPVALLRGKQVKGDLARYWRYAGAARPEALGTGDVSDYSALMTNSQSLIARDVLDSYPFDRHQCLLDIGGGEGAFIANAAKQFPRLCFMLFDVPAVADRARQRLVADRLESRVAIHGGNFISNPLPQGADLVSLVRVIHDHDDATVMALLKAVYRALPPGGAVLIAEPMSGVPGAERVGDAYFGLYLLAMGQGKARRPAEISEMLSQTGFINVVLRKTRRPMMVQVISGVRL